MIIYWCLGARRAAGQTSGQNERTWSADRAGRLLQDGKQVFSHVSIVCFQHKTLLGTHGVKQSIGIKEFCPYLELDDEQRADTKGELLLNKCYDDLKLHTRQYSRTQRKWFTSRFIRRGKLREVGPFSIINCLTLQVPKSLTLNTSRDFFSTVVPFALNRANEFLTSGSFDTSIESPCLIKQQKPHYDDEEYVTKANTVFRCDTCSMDIQSAKNYEEHMKGRKHAKVLMKQQRVKDTSGGAKKQKMDGGE